MTSLTCPVGTLSDLKLNPVGRLGIPDRSLALVLTLLSNNSVTMGQFRAIIGHMEDLAQFIQAAAGAAFLTKMVVDGIKMAVDMPRWMPVLLAFIIALIAEFLLLLSQGAVFTTQLYAQAGIIGMLAWGLAIGATELQKRANKSEETIDAALSLPAGSTRADLKQEMKETE